MLTKSWRFLAASAIVIVPAWVGCAAGVSTRDVTDDGDGGGGGSTSSGQGGAAASSSSSSGAGVGGSTLGGPCVTVADCGGLNSPCTVGACINGVCQKVPSNEFGACDDGLYCTENDICQDGACVAGTQRFCASLDSCHIGVCDEALKTCKNIPGNDGAQCDDMNVCTTAGLCKNGACSMGPPVDCSVFDGECSVGVCDPVLGCMPFPKNDGVACNDGKGSPCSTGKCSQGKCTSVAVDGAACDDGLFCTINEKCANTVCGQGQPNPCAPPGGCWIASCDENADQCTAVPGNDGQACDDGSLCTSGTTCANGACIGGVPANEGAACDDGSGCTVGETCNAGQCNGGGGVTVYFADDFANNNKGWALGPEWQIGFAKASVGGVLGADPASDHSASADNGVAGVVIGGNASTGLHGYYYLESPSFNTANAPAQVVLGFYRWLNSDYDPFMHNTIEVWNGASWITLWTSGGPPGIEDSPPTGMGWTYIQHDLTAHKNAAMRVRFGFDIASGGVFTIGSWNIDDVLVADQACP